MNKVLKFYSKTCGPCKVAGERLNSIKDINIQEIDINEESNDPIIDKWGVKSIPTIIVVNNNEELVKEFKGIPNIKEVEDAIYGR